MSTQNLLLSAAATLMLATAVGCGPSGDADDTDDNKSFFVDGYQDISAPSPATSEAFCNYNKTLELGATVGVDLLQVLPAHTWQGYRPGEAVESTVAIPEFFDCEGSRNIHGILIDTSQYG